MPDARDGRLMTCGSSKLFQSGHFEQEFTFTAVDSFKAKHAKRVAAGKAHTLVLGMSSLIVFYLNISLRDNAGSAYSFGNGSKGQLGYEAEADRLKPKCMYRCPYLLFSLLLVIESLSGVIVRDVACGPHSSFAISGLPSFL